MTVSWHIAHAESSLGWGGQEIRIFTEMMAMRQRGHRLLLCAPSASALFQRCRNASFPVYPLDDRKLAYPWTIAQLARIFRREKVDIVNLHSSRDGWFGGLAGRWAAVPLVLRSRHIEVDYPNRFLSRIAFHYLPHHVLTTSRNISARLIRELA